MLLVWAQALGSSAPETTGFYGLTDGIVDESAVKERARLVARFVVDNCEAGAVAKFATRLVRGDSRHQPVVILAALGTRVYGGVLRVVQRHNLEMLERAGDVYDTQESEVPRHLRWFDVDWWADIS